MNRIELIGRICNDVKKEVSEEESKRPLGILLAVDTFKRDKDGEVIKSSNYIPLKAWGTVAENIRTYKNIGDEVFIEGRISTGSYVDKDEKKVYFTDLIVDKVRFLRNTAKNSNADTDSNSNTSTMSNTNTNSNANKPEYEEVSTFNKDTADIFGDMPFGE